MKSYPNSTCKMVTKYSFKYVYLSSLLKSLILLMKHKNLSKSSMTFVRSRLQTQLGVNVLNYSAV